jgi:hypothetical protein
MLQGFFTPGEPDTTGDYEDRVRKRRLAEALMAQGMDYSPVKSWTQGAARIAQALVGGYESGKYDREQKAADAPGRAILEEERQRRMGGSPSPAMPSATVPSGASAPRAASAGHLPTFAMPGLSEAISSATAKYNLDPSYLPRLAQVESSGGKNLQNPNSTAGGPFGFLDSTGREYGLTNKNDAGTSTDAAARLAVDNRRVLSQRLGRDPSPGELYLAHQQGAGGASALLANPDRPAIEVLTQVYGGNAARARAALVNNGGDLSMTAGQFAQKWIGKFGGERTMPQIAQSGMTPDGMPTSPVPSDAPPMAYAPGQQAIANAMPQNPPMPPPRPGAALVGAVGGQQPQPVTSPPIPQPDGSQRLLAAALSSSSSPQLRAQLMQLYQMTQNQNKATYQTDADGNIIQLDPSGRRPPQVVYRGAVKPTIIPEAGSAIVPDGQGGYKQINAGQQQQDFVETVDGRRIPIPAGYDRKQREEFKATFAKTDSATLQSAPGAFSNLQDTHKNIAGVMANVPGLKQITSPAGSILELFPGSDARATRGRINQLLGDTFLAAFESLKGGGQITEVEGKKAQQAKARLDDARIGFPEYVAALKDFHDAIYSGMEKLKKLPGMEKMQMPPRIDFRVGTQAPTKAPGAVNTAPTPAPKGVSAAEWSVMTPEERAEWN